MRGARTFPTNPRTSIISTSFPLWTDKWFAERSNEVSHLNRFHPSSGAGTKDDWQLHELACTTLKTLKKVVYSLALADGEQFYFTTEPKVSRAIAIRGYEVELWNWNKVQEKFRTCYNEKDAKVCPQGTKCWWSHGRKTSCRPAVIMG